MRRVLYLSICLVLAASAVWAQEAAGKKAVEGQTAVKLTDPAGDVKPISSSGGEKFPGLDVVELALSSDGTELTVTATLENKAEKFANTVLEMHLDTDNDLETGGKSMFLKIGGFERRVDLNACLEYTDGSKACIGALGDDVKNAYAVASVQRYTGKESGTEEIVGGFTAPRVPSDGKVIRATVKYSDLGVKPGQTVRIVTREASGGIDPGAYFPEVLLTLK
jgi:hypothetical protein